MLMVLTGLPFVGCVAESLSTLTGRRFLAYRGTVISLLFFAAGSMSAWGTTCSPVGIEYFGFLARLWGGRFRYTTSMLFALTFIPQFLIGGLTGILLASPAID